MVIDQLPFAFSNKIHVIMNDTSEKIAELPKTQGQKFPVHLNINGSNHVLQLEAWTSLLDALREYLNLTGTKKGCDHGQCGACTILVDGKRIRQLPLQKWI